jgi:alkanesulfonate monooxygenase SsuD/methylene tetrahydromethanopterin reductase-like flavin-dependent oxidoreductase (luciferase family)
VVTGYLNSAAKGIGLARQPEHDMRYEIAEEYMQVVRTQRVFARPEKVHRIRHDGRYFQIEAIHLCEPSPQRTPLIYQAGASSFVERSWLLSVYIPCKINAPRSRSTAPSS